MILGRPITLHLQPTIEPCKTNCFFSGFFPRRSAEPSCWTWKKKLQKRIKKEVVSLVLQVGGFYYCGNVPLFFERQQPWPPKLQNLDLQCQKHLPSKKVKDGLVSHQSPNLTIHDLKKKKLPLLQTLHVAPVAFTKKKQAQRLYKKKHGKGSTSTTSQKPARGAYEVSVVEDHLGCDLGRPQRGVEDQLENLNWEAAPFFYQWIQGMLENSNSFKEIWKKVDMKEVVSIAQDSIHCKLIPLLKSLPTSITLLNQISTAL